MYALLLFLVKSITVSGIMMLWYMLVLKGKHLHNYNRFFLLFTLYASIQVPLLDVHLFTVSQEAPLIVSSTAVMLQEMEENAIVPPEPATHISAIDTDAVIATVIYCISVLLLTVWFIKVLWILNLRRKYSRSVVDGIQVIHTDLPQAPFSFMSCIFWRNDISLDTDNGRLIFMHELAHIRQRHTYDKLACQLLTCIFWMNPFYWILQKELNLVHEYVADEGAVGDATTETATEAFAHMLLQVHNKGAYITPEHRFFSSSIKQRLTMLQTNKYTSYSRLRRIGILPLLAGSILIFSFRPRPLRNVSVIKADRKIVLLLDPAHGGIDMGCNAGSLTEKDVVLKVSKRISDLAPEYNIEAHLTRSTDDYIKLADRAKMAETLHADAFISIHVDTKAGMDTAAGTFEIAINSKNGKAAESEKLAYAVYNNILRPNWRQGHTSSEKNLLVLRENKVPAILIELGHIENNAQMHQLTDDTKLDEMCDAILKGIVDAHKS